MRYSQCWPWPSTHFFHRSCKWDLKLLDLLLGSICRKSPEVHSVKALRSSLVAVLPHYYFMLLDTCVVPFLQHAGRQSRASAAIFPGGTESTILLILFRLLTMQRKRTSTKRFTLFTPQTKFPCYGNSCKKCASLPAIVLFTHVFSRRIKLRGMWLTAISSHGLATIPATDVCIHHYMRQNAYCVLS